MVLHCPTCGHIHVDEDEWATKPHRTHLCNVCKKKWRPANVPTVGVLVLPDEVSNIIVGQGPERRIVGKHIPHGVKTMEHYTDEEARRAIAIVKELAPFVMKESAKEVAEHVWKNGEHILAFGKPAEPKRWPLEFQCPTGTTGVTIEGSRTNGKMERFDDGLAFYQSKPNVNGFIIRHTDMDRLFVAWAEERAWNLPLIAAYADAQLVKLQGGASRDTWSINTGGLESLRAVLDNAKEAG